MAEDDRAPPFPQLAPAPASTTQPQPVRVRGRPFSKGNPGGGRPRTGTAWKNLVKRAAESGGKVLMLLMLDAKTPKETRRRIAEFWIERRYGKAVASIGNPDGSPLFGSVGTTADDAVAKLFAAIRARKDAPAATGAPTSTDPAIAPQAAAGAAGKAPDA